MDQKNSNALIHRFPFMRPGDGRMQFGIECGDGWFELLWHLCKCIESLIGKDFRVSQVKEKFGGLRFYAFGVTDDVLEIIEGYEKKSFTICETCGEKGEIRTDHGYLITICNECLKKVV